MVWRTLRMHCLGRDYKDDEYSSSHDYVTKTRTWRGITKNWLSDTGDPDSVMYTNEYRWQHQPLVLLQSLSRSEEAALRRLRLCRAPTNDYMKQVFPGAGFLSYCTACGPTEEDPMRPAFRDDLEHRVFHCPSTLPLRVEAAPALRAALLRVVMGIPPGVSNGVDAAVVAGLRPALDVEELYSDEELAKDFFQWDLMLLHFHKAFPPGLHLDRHITPPLEIRTRFSDIFKRYMRKSGLTKFLVRSLRTAVRLQKENSSGRDTGRSGDTTPLVTSCDCSGLSLGRICSYFGGTGCQSGSTATSATSQGGQ